MPPQAAAPAQPPAQQQQQQGGFLSSGLVRSVAIFFGLQLVLNPKGPVFKALGIAPKESSVVPLDADNSNPNAARISSAAASPQAASRGIEALPLWSAGTPFSASIYLSTSPNGEIDVAHPELPHTTFDGLTLGDWKWKRDWEIELDVPKSVQQNGSLWADVFLARNGASISSPADPFDVVHTRKLLSRFMPERKARAERNLFEKTDAVVEPEPEQPTRIVSMWYPNLTLTIMSDSAVVPYTALQPPMQQHVHLAPVSPDATGKYRHYPIVFPNEFWNLHSHYTPINETTTRLPLRIELHPISMLKFQLYSSMTHAFEQQAAQQGGMSEMDEIKRALIETSPWLLITTAIVSVLHMLFEFLAFSQDIQHTRKRRDNIGLSVRTIITNVFMQTVIFLYLMDNSEGTSWMILLTQGMGIAIEAWKVTKAVSINVIRSPPGSILPVKLDIRDKHVLSEAEAKTQEYDRLAFRMVSYALGPVLAGYGVYSMLYQTHRSWYSYVISTLTSFVYGAGFATLIPQLIINYKLKSVAHLPMKALAYKTLSTVIDDFFSFVIKMPLLHRLACFRDDIVFAILLYQKYIYKTDYARVNEYGQGGEDDDDDDAPTKPIAGAEKTDENAAQRALAESRKDR